MRENEQNFTALKKLLKLKQHEVPPPGYFDSFSDKVIARIQAGELVAGGSRFEYLQAHAPWLARLISAFESKGSVVGMSLAGVCLFVMAGVVMSEKTEKAGATTAAAETQALAVPGSSIATMPAAQTLLADAGGGIQISTNPASLQPVATLFGQPNPLAPSMQASFAPNR